jgi:hypothetical protein
MEDDDKIHAVLAGLSDDPLYAHRCIDCLSVFYTNRDGTCQKPECIAKASRRRTETVLRMLRERRK